MKKTISILIIALILVMAVIASGSSMPPAPPDRANSTPGMPPDGMGAPPDGMGAPPDGTPPGGFGGMPGGLEEKATFPFPPDSLTLSGFLPG